jgi:hypothetical protein
VSRNAQFILAIFVLTAWDCRAAAADFLTASPTNYTSRVVIAQGDDLLEAYLPDDMRVAAIVNLGLLQLTHTTNLVTAWRTLVTTNDTVGIKVFCKPGPYCGTRPAVVAAIVQGLIQAGLAPANIVIWDKDVNDLRAAGYTTLGRELGVRVAGAVEAGYDPQTYYLPDTPIIGMLVWGDLEFGQTNREAGRRSFVTKLVTRQMTKIISVAPLINENSAGVCGQFFSLSLGSVDNTRRFEGDTDRLSVALPEIMALPAIGDHVVLNVTDALLGQYQGGPAGYLQYATVLNQIWLSHDPVALDVLSLKELAREAKMFGTLPVPSESEIYTNASLLELGANDPARIRVEKVRNF